jgi:Nif-specific regulatory protein
MQDHPWPGNVRQLQSVIMRLVMLAHGSLIDLASVSAQLLAEPDPLSVRSAEPSPAQPVLVEAPAAASAVKPTMTDLIRPYLPVASTDLARVREALERSGGNRSRAAQLLGMTRRQFTYRLEKLGLRCADAAPAGEPL